jgi:hypothetical protein
MKDLGVALAGILWLMSKSPFLAGLFTVIFAALAGRCGWWFYRTLHP